MCELGRFDFVADRYATMDMQCLAAARSPPVRPIDVVVRQSLACPLLLVAASVTLRVCAPTHPPESEQAGSDRSALGNHPAQLPFRENMLTGWALGPCEVFGVGEQRALEVRHGLSGLDCPKNEEADASATIGASCSSR